MSPLMWAVKDSNMKLIQYLVEHGANVNAQNNNSRAVLELAVTPEVKEYLKKKGAKTSQELMNS
jgi:ankyrin repeat protein